MLVLKSGGVYFPKHVTAIADQLHKHAAGVKVLALSDTAISDIDCLPLPKGLPGWWSKMFMFSPSVKGDILYFDLDTAIIDSLEDILKVNKLTLLRDFYRDGVRKPEGLQSSVMFLPETDRAEVWNAFTADPKKVMRECAVGGDQEFLERFYLQKAQRWQDVVPGQIASYKVHCKQGVPPGTRVVCAHGKPKLWNTPEFKHLYE